MRLTRFLLLALVLVVATGCGGPRAASQDSEIKTVAIVSFTVNNYGFFGRGAIDQSLINANINAMLEETETVLSKSWSVKPVSSFINDQSYLDLMIVNETNGLSSPVIKNSPMPICSANRREVVKGVLTSDQAQSLCANLGVDAVVLVYSEWTIDSGKFVPTVKALTKNCFSMYKKNGQRLPYQRKDIRGERVIGGPFAGVTINADTIDQWVNAYQKSVVTIFGK